MIIGLCGLAGAGKDTVAGVIAKEYGYKQHALADDLRNALYVLNPIIGRRWLFLTFRLQDAVDRYGWDEAKRRYPEIRRNMQVLGTEVGREQWGQRFWLDRAFAKFGQDDDVVISDVRMQNEVDEIRKHGGVVVWVNRPGVGKMNHKSEQMDFATVCDAIILNAGDVVTLRISTLECIEELNGVSADLF